MMASAAYAENGSMNAYVQFPKGAKDVPAGMDTTRELEPDWAIA